MITKITLAMCQASVAAKKQIKAHKDAIAVLKTSPNPSEFQAQIDSYLSAIATLKPTVIDWALVSTN